MTDAASLSDLRARREHAERQALGLLGVQALVMAVVCGAIIVSGWFAGVLEDRFERFFWLGSVLALVSVLVAAAAAFPGGDDDARVIRRVRTLSRIGLTLLAVAPELCLGALVADYYL